MVCHAGSVAKGIVERHDGSVGFIKASPTRHESITGLTELNSIMIRGKGSGPGSIGTGGVLTGHGCGQFLDDGDFYGFSLSLPRIDRCGLGSWSG